MQTPSEQNNVTSRMPQAHATITTAEPCDLCGSTSGWIVGRWARDLKPLRNVMCAHCGLVHQEPLPTQADLDRYYEIDYRVDYKGALEPQPRHIKRDYERGEERMEKLAPYLGARARILDVGSGTGIFLKLAADAGHLIEGVEPNKGYAQWAQRELGLEITIAHWEKMELPANAYDLIVSHHVMEHLRSPMKALEQFYKWSAPNGLLYVSVPNIGDRDASPFNRFHRAHVFGFSPESLIMMARKAGFALAENQETDTTTLIFRRLDEQPDDWFCYPDHAAELAAFFSDNTLFRYLLRPKAYIRLAEHIKAGFDERKELTMSSAGKPGQEKTK